MDEPGQRMVRIAACLRGLFSARQSSEDFGYGFPAPSTRMSSFWPSFRRALAATVLNLEPPLLPETDTSPRAPAVAASRLACD